MNELKIIFESQNIVSAFATSAVISMALSAYLYNGYYSKIWRAAAVLIGFILSVLILIKGTNMDEFNLSVMFYSLVISFLFSMLGFFMGVFIYKRALKNCEKKHNIECNFHK